MSDWSETTLGDLCKMYQPKTIGKKDMSADGEYPVFGANGIMGRYHSFNHEEPQLVIGCRGACGSVHITEARSWITGNSMVVQPDLKKADTNYLRYFFLGPADLGSIISGAAQPQITQTALKPVKVPLPSLEEQKRIVAALDQAFAALDRARANAEANLADAEEFRAQAVEAALEALGDPEPIGPHVELLSGFAFKSKGYSENSDDIRLIRGDNIVQGKFRWDGVKRWPIADREVYERYELALDDVLIAMDRTWVSAGIKFAVVDQDALPSLLVQRVARLRTRSSILPRFLAYCVGSKLFERYVLDIQTGLGVPHVSGKQIEAFEIPVPDIESQEAVVEKLDVIHRSAERLLANAKAKLSDLEDLRQSILQKAFAGELA